MANEKGLERALAAPNLTHVGYPFSLSETFQQRNTNRSIEASWPLVGAMVERTEGRLGLVVYLSMAFGNPYGDPWSVEAVLGPSPGLRKWACGRSPSPTPTGWRNPSGFMRS